MKAHQKLHWVRIVDSQVIFPYIVNWTIRRIANGDINSPTKDAHHVSFLSQMMNEFFEGSIRFTNESLRALDNSSVDLLVKLGILSRIDTNQVKWNITEFVRQLRNEICGNIWLTFPIKVALESPLQTEVAIWVRRILGFFLLVKP